MQRLYVLLFAALALALAACGDSTREEVIERYNSGAKKTVAIYEGTGSEESLIERRMYSEGGDLIRVQNRQDGTAQGYLDLHASEYDGLLGFLSEGRWIRSGMTDSDLKGRKAYYEESFVVRGDTVKYMVRSQDPEAGQDTTTVSYMGFIVIAPEDSMIQAEQFVSLPPKADQSFQVNLDGVVQQQSKENPATTVDTFRVMGPNQIVVPDQESLVLGRLGGVNVLGKEPYRRVGE